MMVIHNARVLAVSVDRNANGTVDRDASQACNLELPRTLAKYCVDLQFLGVSLARCDAQFFLILRRHPLWKPMQGLCPWLCLELVYRTPRSKEHQTKRITFVRALGTLRPCEMHGA